MLTLQEISDRLEIQDILARYSDAVDRRAFDELDEIFTADAIIDYSAMGGPSGDIGTSKEFLRLALPGFASHQHLMGLARITIDGDAASCRTPCHNPMLLRAGEPDMMTCGLWYVDVLDRTPEGWRIHTRTLEKSYMV
jgi:hypothetical protein